MQDKPYYCPNCRANRVKFSVKSTYSQQFMKDAITGEIKESAEAFPVDQVEPDIQCMVCQFTTNEMRFIKQAEREPRMPAGDVQSYT